MRRILAISAAAVGAMLVALALYLAFGDLSRHKGRIEAYVTQRIGHPFAIDGPFSVDLLPSVKVEAERIRIGNAPWASTPQMVQVGRMATEIDLWSLFSGPVIVRSLELRDVTIFLEKDRSGARNWSHGESSAMEPVVDEESSGFTKLPVAFQLATVSNLTATWRAPDVQDRIAQVKSLTIRPDASGMLNLDFSGAIQEHPATLKGQAGPLEALLAGHDIRLDLSGGLGNLRFTAQGGFERLAPLDGADLTVSLENPELGTLLRNLRLPPIASGRMDVKFTLKDAGELTDLDLTALAGDISLRTSGKLAVLGLRDSDLTIKASIADAARLASIFDIKGVPAAALTFAGRMVTTRKRRDLKDIHATLAGYEARFDGSIPVQRGGAAQLRFDLTLPSLADLKSNLPALPLKVRGEGSYKSASKEKDTGSPGSLLSARNIKLDLAGEVGATRFTAQGGVGRLDPLEGADLAVSVEGTDVVTLLQRLDLPLFASGQVDIKATLRGARKLSDLDLTARLGDLSLHTTGKLQDLRLRNSDLTFEAEAADAARLASAFDIKGVPAAALSVTGHLIATPMEIRLDGVHATLGTYETRVDGTLPVKRAGTTQLQFDVAIPSLEIFKASLPPLPLRVRGALMRQSDKIELTDLVANFGESEVQGSVTLTGTEYRQVEADLSAPLLDVTPFLPKKVASGKPAPKAEKKRYLFGEKPLRFPTLGNGRAKMHLTSAVVRFSKGELHDVDATLTLGDKRLQAQMKAHGGFGGSVDGTIDLTPGDAGSAAIKMNVTLKDVRSGLASGEGVRPEEVPPVSIWLDLASNGASPRQLVSVASGSILVSQGPGKTKNGLLDRVGGDIVAELLGKLNPFSKQDPYTQVDCAIARVDIANGKAVVDPILMQTRKVAITANGTVDLKTEKLQMQFNTRPRQGIGISPGMFTNPFLELTGTLASPSIGVGTKGVTSGAVAAATGGLSVLAKGVVDRAMGETNQCKDALEQARQPVKGP